MAKQRARQYLAVNPVVDTAGIPLGVLVARDVFVLAAEVERLRRYEEDTEGALARAQADADRLRERDDWLRVQLGYCIEDAATVARTTGLAIARAVVSDLADARAALAVSARDREPDQEKETHG
jgi:hypothetical protein